MRIEEAMLGSLLAAALVGVGPLDARANEPMATTENAVDSPAGWSLAGSKPKAYNVGVDSKVKRSGKAAAFLRSVSDPDDGFGTLMQTISAVEFRGKRVRLQGWVKSENVKGWAGLWMRVDGRHEHALAFDNMSDRAIKGTTDWTQYHVVLDADKAAESISFGTLLTETGALWIDDLELSPVPTTVPTTELSLAKTLPPRPVNLGFDD
ncbi:hypothetical protein WMF11_36120 [Sorangium sp. So ce295]|uniref:hypothetical protein n=1 Tax=Sorangium sp. So ce295 TaxID=3133295 RepID=UPI003F60572B